MAFFVIINKCERRPVLRGTAFVAENSGAVREEKARDTLQALAARSSVTPSRASDTNEDAASLRVSRSQPRFPPFIRPSLRHRLVGRDGPECRIKRRV